MRFGHNIKVRGSVMGLKQGKRLFFLFISIFTFSLQADLKDGPPADGESILLIYTTVTDFSTDLKTSFIEALTAVSPSAQVDEIKIAIGDGSGPGFYDELVAQTGEKTLSKWCQVYDLRFRDDRNNVGWTGQSQEDVITYVGTNTDWELFEEYLDMGGSLFLQGEHHDFYVRNSNMIMFINSVATSPITQQFISIQVERVDITDFSSTIENFNSDFNSLDGGKLRGNYVGGVDIVTKGSGQPLTTLKSGAMAMALVYLPENLKTSMGRLIVSFESNAFAEDGLKNSTSTAWIQNVYDLLSGCYRYEIEKTFEPDTGKVGQEGTFKIHYKNNGEQDLQNFVVRDTIPTCLEFISSNPAPSGISGNAFWWNLPNMSPGESGDIIVTFKSIKLPPCD